MKEINKNDEITVTLTGEEWSYVIAGLNAYVHIVKPIYKEKALNHANTIAEKIANVMDIPLDEE